MVDQRQPDPEPEDEDEVEGTPAGEQPTDSTPEPEADQSAAAAPPPPSQAEYTRAQQAYGALKVKLGLPKTATRAEVDAAVDAVMSKGGSPVTEPEPDADEDPRYAQLRQERDEARQQAIMVQMDTERAISGDLADDAFRFVNLARDPKATPAEMVQAARELVLAHRDAFTETDETDETGDEEPGTPESDIGLSEGDSPTASPETSGRRNRETPATGAIRGLFKAAVEGTRRR